MNCKTLVPRYGKNKGQEVQSELFAQLVDHFQGDVEQATAVYEVAFSESFMDFIDGDWTAKRLPNTLETTEPNIATVLQYMESRADDMLPGLSEETQQALAQTEMADLIIPELGVVKQAIVVDYIAAIVARNMMESDRKSFKEEELFDKLEEYFGAKIKELKDTNPEAAAEYRKIKRNFPKLKAFAIERLAKINQISVLENIDNDFANMERVSHEDGATFKLDGKKTLSARLRRFFHFIPDATVDKEGFIVDKDAYIPGIVETVPFDVVYNTLTSLLSGQRADFDGMVNHLTQFIDAYPWLQNVIDKLEESGDTVKTEFVVAMSKHYVSMKFVMWDVNNDGSYSLRVFDANANAIGRQIQENWYQNFLNGESTAVDPNNSADLIMNPKVQQQVITQFESWFTDMKRMNVDTEGLAKLKKEARAWLELFGIELSDKAWEEIKSEKYKKFLGRFRNKGGVFRLLYENAKNRGTLALSIDNPFSGSAFSKLAEIEAKYSPFVLSNSHRTGADIVYSHALNKYNVKRVRDLKEDRTLLDALSQLSYSKESIWLKQFIAAREEIEKAEANEEYTPNEAALEWLDNFNISYMGIEALKRMGSSAGAGMEMKSMDSAEHEVTKIGLFQNKGNNKVYFVYPTMSDKTTVMVVETTKSLVTFGKDKKLSSDTIDLVYSQLVLPEINRILRRQEMTDEINDEGYENGWHLFYAIPELNNLDVIFNADGTLKTDILSEKPLINAVKALIKSHVESLVDQKLDEWDELGIGKLDLENKQRNSFLDIVYMSAQMSPLAATREEKIRFAASDYVVNYLVANANIHHLIVGDPALYYKSGVIAKAKENLTTEQSAHAKALSNQGFIRQYLTPQQRIELVESTFLNEGKRLAGDMAPGYDLEDEGNNSFKVLFVRDTAVSSLAQDYFKKLLGLDGYGKIDSADAQEFTTLLEHLYIMRRTGKISSILYDKVSQIIKQEIAKDNFDYMEKVKDELDTKEWAVFQKIVYQPMKPVYVNNVMDVDADVDRRVYIKSSSFPLSPDLVADNQLNELRKFMEKNGIDRVAFHTATKVGSPSKVNMPFIVNGETKKLDLEALQSNPDYLTKATRVLPRDGFRIQQEIPYDAEKREVNRGTQESKLLFANILYEDGFKFQGKPYTGGKLFEQYNARYQEVFSIARKDLMHDITDNGIVNIHKLRKLLVKEAKERNYPINDIFALNIDPATGQFSMPLWASNSSDRIQALLNSIVDNRIRKVEMPGKSFVLGTQEGFMFEEDYKGKSDVIFLDNYDPATGLKPMSIVNGKFQPGQVLVPFKFLDHKGRALNIEEFIVEVDGKKMLDLNRFDSNLLKMFGFRIPTQGHNSMVYLEIAGFLPKKAGDLIIAPRDLVAQMGSDFDVDKLYTYMYHTVYSPYTQEVQDEIDRMEAEIQQLYNDNTNLLSREEKQKTFDELKTEYDYLSGVLEKVRNTGKFKVESINALGYFPTAEVEPGQRLITSFRAFVTDAVGKGQFPNPDKVDFIKLKAYARNLIDNEQEKLSRINASTDGVGGQAERLDSWIVDQEEIKYAKALKTILKMYNKSFNKQKSVLLKGMDKIEERQKEIIEASKELTGAVKKLKDFKKESSSSTLTRLKKDSVNMSAEIKALMPSMEVTLEETLRDDGIDAALDEARAIFEDLENVLTSPEEAAKVKKAKRRILNYLERYTDNLKNDIVDIHFSIMESTSDNVRKQIHSPLAYGELKGGKDIAAKVDQSRKARLGADKTFSPFSDSYQKQKFLNAMAGRVGGVGVFSLDSVLNALMQQAEYLQKDSIFWAEDLESKAPKKIVFGKKVSMGNLSGEKVIGRSNRTKTDVIAAYQSAAVDNEKEQIFDKLNINNYTYDVIRILNQLGFEETEVAGLIAQDALFDYVRAISSAENTLTDYNPGAKAAVVRNHINKLFNAAKLNSEKRDEELRMAREYVDKYDGEALLEYIEKGEGLPDYNLVQLGAFLKFIELEEGGKGLKRIQSASNTDSAGVGKSLFASMAKLDAIYNLHKNIIINGESVLGNYIKDEKGRLIDITYEGIPGFAIQFGLETNVALWSQVLPFTDNAVMGIMEEIMIVTGRQGIEQSAKADFYEKVWKEMKSFTFSATDILGLSTESADAERRRLIYDVIQGTDTPIITHYSLPRILDSLRASEFYRTNPFLKRLQIRLGKGDLPSSVTFNATTAENYDEINLYTAFMEMLVNPQPIGRFNDKDMTTQDLARELILYSYLTGGVQEASQFVKFIPVEYLTKIGFSEKLKGLSFHEILDPASTKASPYENSIFTTQYVQHIPSEAIRAEKGELFSREENWETNFAAVTEVFIKPEYYEKFGAMILFSGDVWFPPFISIYDETVPQKYHLFANNGQSYIRIPVAGTRLVGRRYTAPIKEYSAGKPMASSVISNYSKLKDVTQKRIPQQAAKAIAPKQTKPDQALDLIDNMDLTNGGKGVMIDALENIVALTTNVHYRELAEQFIPIIETIAQLEVEIIDSIDKPFVARTERHALGKTKIIVNKVQIDSRALLEEAILHELVHATTSDLVDKYLKDPSSVTAQQKKIIARLNKIFEAYSRIVREEFGLKASDDVKAFLKMKGDAFPKSQSDRLYAAHNLKEFFALGLTNADVQRALNDTGLFEKFLQVLRELLESIGVLTPDGVAQAVVNDIMTLIQTKVSPEPNQAPAAIQPTGNARFSSPSKPLKVFVDGSDIKGTGKIGYGVYLKHGGKEFGISGHYSMLKDGRKQLEKELGITVEGSPSNGVMELYGSLVAIQNTPKEEFININQDLEGVQLWILSRMIQRLSGTEQLGEEAYKKTFWKGLSLEEKKALHAKVAQFIHLDPTIVNAKVYGDEGLSKGYYSKDKTIRAIVDKIVDEIMQRPGKVSYTWVKGHAGVEGNEAVDAVAKSDQDYNQFGDMFKAGEVAETSKKLNPVANIPQNLISGIESFGTKQEANSKAKELLGDNPHSIDMIIAGIRTRTTRSVGEMLKYNVKVGDVVKQFGKSADGTTKQVLTRITAIHFKGSPEFLSTWWKEGWTADGVEAIKRFKEGAAAIEFEVIKDNAEVEQKAPSTEKKNIKNFTLFSGGAYGGDTLWDLIGREFGLENAVHFKAESAKNNSSALRKAGVPAKVLTPAQLDYAYQQLNLLYKKNFTRSLMNDLAARDYYQVAEADAVFALGVVNLTKVEGGTNHAVQFAIKMNKPVYVFNIAERKGNVAGTDIKAYTWYTWDKAKGRFVETSRPSLTEKFAGVGSRQLEQYNTLNKQSGQWEPTSWVGKEAADIVKTEVRAVYEQTLAPSTDDMISMKNQDIVDRLMQLNFLSKKCD